MQSAKEAREEWLRQQPGRGFDPSFKQWAIAPDNEGNFPDAQITHAILQDIRTLLKSIRAMAKFFVVLTVIGLIVEFLYVLITLTH